MISKKAISDIEITTTIIIITISALFLIILKENYTTTVFLDYEVKGFRAPVFQRNCGFSADNNWPFLSMIYLKKLCHGS